VIVSKNITEHSAADEALKQSREALSAILSTSGIVFFILNQAGEFQLIKGEILNKTGIRESDFIGKNINHFRLRYPGIAEGAGQAFKGIKTSIVTQFSDFFFEIWFVPIYDSDNSVNGVMGIMNDITAFESHRGTEKLYRTLFDLSPVGIVLESTDGIILEVNQAICRTAGYDVHELIGKHVSIFAGEVNKYLVDQHIKEITEGKTLVFEVESFRSDGSKYHAELIETCISLSNNQKAILSLSNDISERKNFENALREGEIKYRNIFENIQDVFYQTDNQGNIITISPSIERYSGFTPDELIGLNVSKLYIDPDERESLLQVIRSNGEAVDFEIRLKAKKGQLVYVSVNAHFLYDGTGAINGIEGSLRDVSERRLALEQIRRLSLAVEQSPVMILVTSPKGIIEYVNKRYLEISGYSVTEIHGYPLESVFLPENGHTFFNDIFQILNHGGEWKGELQNHKSDRGTFWVSASISVIRNERGEMLNYLAILEDITERKQFMNEIVEARSRAEQSDNLKSTLLANLSHEFRTPMNGILGFAQILYYDSPTEELRDLAEKIFISGERLMKTLDSIMWLAQIESGLQLFEEAVELGSKLSSIVASYGRKIEAKGITFICNVEKGFVVKTDSMLIGQALSELLDNALKFTDFGSITLDITLQVIDGVNYVLIEVKDTGIGIQPDMQEQVFKEFRQASEGINREYEGTGLGLAIVKKIATKLNGFVKIDSNIGKGAVFSFGFEAKELLKIDVKHKPEFILNKQPKVASPVKLPHVLIVEDNEINRELIAVFLGGICEADMARNASMALEKAESNNYDAFFMDINLRSAMDGLSLTKLIRQMEKYRNTPVIAVTGYTLAGDKERLIHEGCSHYIAKPFERREFVQLVKQALDLR
jgi:PAS domain S-box-containing protein